jgi:nitrate/TMAO reductase-like tetraheme cytochrome c subunit
MCNHEDSKVTERLFNKFGKLVATSIFCLKCGAKEKIVISKTVDSKNYSGVQKPL